MDKGGHYDVEMKGWMQKVGHLYVQIKRMDKEGHYDVEIKGGCKRGALSGAN